MSTVAATDLAALGTGMVGDPLGELPPRPTAAAQVLS